MNIPTYKYALYAEFGIAAEKAQVLKTMAGNVALRFLATSVKPQEIGPDATGMFKDLVDDVNRKTFGTLVMHLKKTMSLK